MTDSIAPPLPTTQPPIVDDEPAVKTALIDDVPAADAVDEKPVNGATAVEPIAPPNPKENAIAWLQSLGSTALHKVNYHLLNWLNTTASTDETEPAIVPGSKKEATTKNQFLAYLRDGSVLAKFANRLQPGAIETVHLGETAKEKSNQIANIDAFRNFLKERLDLDDDQVFSVSSLQDEGKHGYPAVFNTLVQFAMKVPEKFPIEGIDAEKLMQIAAQAVRFNLIETILGFFKRGRTNQTAKQLVVDEKSDKEKVIEEEKAAASEEEEAICTVKKMDDPAETKAIPTN